MGGEMRGENITVGRNAERAVFSLNRKLSAHVI